MGIIGFTAWSVAVAGAQGLKLENVWSLAPGDRPYLTTDSSQRGLAYNPATGHLLLVDRLVNAASVYVLDSLTGADVGVLDTTALTGGGTFYLNKVGVGDDGVIYAANFGTIGGSTPTFVVYRWSDESSPSTIAYSADPGAGNNQQWGATFAVRGAGTNTQIVVASTAGNVAALLTTADGTNFTSQVLTTDVLPGFMGGSVAFGTNNSFWAKSADGPLVQLAFNTNSGTATTTSAYSVTNFPGTLALLNVDVADGLLAGIDVTTPDMADLYSISSTAAAPVLLSSTNLPTDNSNGGFNGAVAFGPGTVFTLDSNNGLQAYDIVPSAAPVPPVMVLQPVAVTVFSGLPAALTASAAGSAPLSYQWQKNGQPVTGATNTILSITNVQMSDDADYAVVVTNLAGAVTSFTAHLTVLPPGVLTPVWTVAPGSRAYLTASGNNQRGMGYNPVSKHVLVVNRAGSLSVNVMDGATGADMGTMSVAGISGGTFPLLVIGVADDGVIYGANFGSVSGTTPTIYRWANESAIPTIAYKGDPANGTAARQWGNVLCVRGSGTNTQILLPTGGQEFVAVLTTTDGTNFAANLISGIPTGTIMEGAAFGAGNTFWGKADTTYAGGGQLYYFSFDLTTDTATQLAAYGGDSFDLTVDPIGVDPINHLLAGVSIISGAHSIELYNLAGPNGPALLQSVAAHTSNPNTLFRGGVAFGNDMLFVLDTNNGISAYVLPYVHAHAVNGQVQVSWAATLLGFKLQSTADLASGIWSDVPAPGVAGGLFTTTLAPSAGREFFRLVK